MIRPLALASLITLAVLPGLPGLASTARADGFGDGAPLHRARHPLRHAAHPRFAPPPPELLTGPGPDLAYGWLPRNLNLPIYNAPSEGPAPQL